MTFQDYTDSRLSLGDVTVYDKHGNVLCSLKRDDDAGLKEAAPFFQREVIKDVRYDFNGQYVVYLDDAKPMLGVLSQDKERTYQGKFKTKEDEEAWSFDYRAREKKLSDKQLQLINEHLIIYKAIRQPRWPEDPSQLLAYEASDAITAILARLPKKKKGQEEPNSED